MTHLKPVNQKQLTRDHHFMTYFFFRNLITDRFTHPQGHVTTLSRIKETEMQEYFCNIVAPSIHCIQVILVPKK
jgi:hypothetical protein